MIAYHSNSRFPTPPHQQAVVGLAAQQSPYAGQNHQDVTNSLLQARAVDMSRYAQQKQDEYESAASQSQRELALAGLNMMNQASSQNQEAQTSRLQMLLRGLL